MGKGWNVQVEPPRVGGGGDEMEEEVVCPLKSL